MIITLQESKTMFYPIKIFYSDEDKGFIATSPDLPGCSAFGETEEEALKEIRTAQELWIETARKEKRHIPKPSTETGYSGRILLRTPKTLHQSLMEKAKAEGVSLNQFILYLLSRDAGNVPMTKHK
jgi:predicted RNase H-like HicB family nuclease